MIDMNPWLETCFSFKTQKEAKDRLDKCMAKIKENGSKFMIYRKDDGTFVPLVFASPRDWDAGVYASHNVAVTN
jgi:hypothetical protein